jgi:hypothetical protein
MLRDDRPPSREELENLWRTRLDKAADRYNTAKKTYRLVADEDRQGLTPSPDGRYAIRQARQEEAAARAEYIRVLRIFTDLILHGKIPKTGSDSEG